MLKFFRRIRQNLLFQGKTSRYFKYAIGEIVLVVIGILIALQINTWNKERIEQKKEHTYLTNIKRDLQHQLDSIDIHLSYEKKYIENAKPFLDTYFENDKLVIDSSLMMNLSLLTERKTFVSTDPTYTDLTSSGNIDLLQDQIFKDKLIVYYQNLERIEKIIQNNNTQLTDQLFITKIIGLIYFNIGDLPNSNRLIEISKRILQNKENELLLVNMTTFRQSLAIGHTKFLAELKTHTEELIELVNKLL
jgi:hypothetical protein